jgi:hypothetical protein
MKLRHLLRILLAACLSSTALVARSFDVVVVGATPAGVAAAVNAAREGVTVALVEESGHLGGLASGGLSNTDFRTFPSLGGTFREFMHRVEQHYIREYGPKSQQVIDAVVGGYYEPRVARRVFEQMLAEQPQITVLLHHRLAATKVAPAGGIRRLEAAEFMDLRTSRRTVLDGKMFIDATYEGDLAAAAKAPYWLGCESKYDYNEDVSPFEESNKYVQTYNFRATLSRDPKNRIEIQRPQNYDESEFLLILDHLRTGQARSWANPGENFILKVRPIPNLKADFNDAPATISMALKNVNHPWPEGSPEVRERIFQRYKDYTLGLFWFLGNHPGIPEEIRRQMKEWGLPKDEYVDTDHWSPALYVREGRRIVGEYVFTQHDTQPEPGSGRARLHQDSIGIGDYALNCHGVYSPAPGVNVGRHGRSVRPFQMPYRIMVPVELDGLLVPVAVSATHVGYSAIRMEPAWTALGQAAGLAAAMAAKEGVAARRVDVPRLQARLHEAGAFTVYITDLFPERNVPRPAWDPPGYFTAHVPAWPSITPYSRAAQYFGTRGFFHRLSPEVRGGAVGRSTGQWSISYPGHAVGFDQPIDVALASHWLMMAGVKPAPQLAADGRLSRGEFLNRLYRHLHPH